ncbi:MAG: hypothetical protein COU81_00335 [Candidatus Portnoybacteria bacterium CG10_big_fil_rev_8_21_14_0_10_36_7]|uniref:CYTH domain-containing protein n=1 Tax=Candidatus Portnoybacteria bacterium CG10_big_fil_rev_8_21_14_0_10_36_7 TaxID=1974812 RepID=A0A2M8KF02_9BACT|nr:MAG: hypothetical protein COU81_00335 [Candidatus Portnoybacteria bacterium CG10_big_fil_rev_8_21_14_0_10_36_7]
MSTKFECEVRFFIADIDVFKKHLKNIKAKLLFPYTFTDYYYKPQGKKWNPEINNLRIRDW